MAWCPTIFPCSRHFRRNIRNYCGRFAVKIQALQRYFVLGRMRFRLVFRSDIGFDARIGTLERLTIRSQCNDRQRDYPIRNRNVSISLSGKVATYPLGSKLKRSFENIDSNDIAAQL
jgi:hypothetical protein